MMFVEITAEGYKNHFGRVIPVGTVIPVPEIKGRQMIQNDEAILSSRNPQREYLNRLNQIKAQTDKTEPSEDGRQRSWFGRLLGT
ncbi:MAG TPA: hypothetical protein PKH94_07280 [Bacteroidales bacterium]|nr:hypothetical protein [Bacteroidales bacterium]